MLKKKKQTISLYETNKIMDYFNDPNPLQIIILAGGPLNGVKWYLKNVDNVLVFKYTDLKVPGVEFRTEYVKEEIIDFGTWKYVFFQTYEYVKEEENDFEQDYLNHDNTDDWESEGEEWKDG